MSTLSMKQLSQLIHTYFSIKICYLKPSYLIHILTYDWFKEVYLDICSKFRQTILLTYTGYRRHLNGLGFSALPITTNKGKHFN